MENKTQSDIYATADFMNSVYLLCHDARLIQSHRVGEHRVEFVMDKKSLFGRYGHTPVETGLKHRFPSRGGYSTWLEGDKTASETQA